MNTKMCKQMKRGALQLNIQRLKTLSLIDIVVEAQAELLFESPYLLLSPVIFSLATNLSPYHPCLSLKCSVLAWRLITIGLMPCLGFPIPQIDPRRQFTVPRIRTQRHLVSKRPSYYCLIHINKMCVSSQVWQSADS